MRAAIVTGSAVLLTMYAQAGAEEADAATSRQSAVVEQTLAAGASKSLASGSVAIALGGQTATSAGIVISSPLGRNVLQRDGRYFVTGAYICRTLTTPPRVIFNRIDIARPTCLNMATAEFTVRPDAPLTKGILTVVHSGGASTIGTFYITASATAPAPAPTATPLLSVSPVQLSFTGRYNALNVSPYRQTFEIRNAGGGTLTWTVTENHPWLTTIANEQCAVPSICPDCGIQCTGGIKGTPDSRGATTFSGSGTAIVAVRAPGWQLPSGFTTTGTISISSNGGNANVSVTIVTPTDVELDCSNGQDDDRDGSVDSGDGDCAPNPYAGF
ncbi:MAG: hypothetical protein WD793_13950 [Steroidobacteraceae bacterium]